MSSLFEATYNPDVLSCLANLSNDEVFTSPELANHVLDMLPNEIWRDPNATFLDPGSKSGVFLREIAKRLIEGLEEVYPDLQERLDHIYKKQVFGIALTELTSLLSRRSLYCSKYPNSRYSVVEFETVEGNIRYKAPEHTWYGGRCVYCGAAQKTYERESALEQYAYEFIHMDNPEEVFNMKFDVIVGNPPYQLGDGGAQQSAVPLYHKFIQQAKRLNPRYLTMIVPARWYAGGRGLDDFRKEMLDDARIRELHDFPETDDVFHGLNVRGGICYFLWDRDYSGECKVVSHRNGQTNESTRPLDENDAGIFIRYNEGIDIIRKVTAFHEPSFAEFVSASKPFGLRGFFKEYVARPTGSSNIKLYRFGDNGYVSRDQVLKNKQWIDEWKVIIPEASPGADDYPHLVLSLPIVSEPGSICTETYLVIGPFDSRETCENVASYIKTKFFRFLVLMIKNTQHTTQKVYRFVPVQDFSKSWTDEELYEKYGVTEHERQFIDSLVKER